MVVGVLRLELVLHAPGSLKEKRGIVQRILVRCRERFPVSGSETGLHDLWQRVELGFAMVSRDESSIHTVFRRIEEEVEKTALADVTDRYQEYLHY